MAHSLLPVKGEHTTRVGVMSISVRPQTTTTCVLGDMSVSSKKRQKNTYIMQHISMRFHTRLVPPATVR